MSKDAHAFPAALSNDGYIDLCILEGNVSWGDMMKIFNGFDKGLHYNHNHVHNLAVNVDT